MLTGDAKWGAFKGCEAFVLPSHQENFGVVVAEALVCGKVVLISDKVQVWREVQDYAAGFVADDTFEGTARLLDSFLGSAPDTLATMERNAERLFYEKFDLAKVIDNLFVTLSTITKARPARETV
jgi:glycosyltransferase involved in cell wall biosynthesis